MSHKSHEFSYTVMAVCRHLKKWQSSWHPVAICWSVSGRQESFFLFWGFQGVLLNLQYLESILSWSDSCKSVVISWALSYICKVTVQPSSVPVYSPSQLSQLLSFVTHSTPCDERRTGISVWERESWYFSFLSDMSKVVWGVCGVLGYTTISK